MPVPVDSLKKCALFSGFTDTGLTIIAEIAKTRDVPQGLSVFLKGAAADSLFIVEGGGVEIFIADTRETSRVLATVDPGESFGELALLRPGKRAVSARARAASRVIEIKRADFNEILKTRPQACVKLMLNIIGAVERRFGALGDDLEALL